MTNSETSEPATGHDWVPVGADYGLGSWTVLWARRTETGEWEFMEGSVGFAHIDGGTPGGVKSSGGVDL